MEVANGNKVRRNSIAMVTPITRTPGVCRSHFPAPLTPVPSRSSGPSGQTAMMQNSLHSPCSSASSSPVSNSPPRSSSPEDKPLDLCSRSLNINTRNHHHSHHGNGSFLPQDRGDLEEEEDDEHFELGMRPRTYSLPATHARMLRPAENGSNVWRDVYTCPVRSFSRTTKGVVNKGDSVRKCSISSILSSSSTVTDTEERVRTMSIASQDSIGPHICGGVVGVDGGADGTVGQVAPSYFRVAILGTIGVGKSALCRQFMSSEYLGTYENNCDGEEGPAIVSVMLDGEESMIEFYEGPTVTQEDDNNYDAYIIVFSVTDRSSFDVATFLSRHLRVEVGTDRPIILVANKVDLVRQRRVSNTEAREVATTFDSKYTETSAALNDHVDDLLVGTLSQIRLHLCPPPTSLLTPPSSPRNKCRTPSPLSLFSRFVKYATRKSNSCDNLLLQ